MSKKYQIIVADPPWPMGRNFKGAAKDDGLMDYPLMTLEQIRGIDVKSVSAKNSVLFLWCIDKMLLSGRRLLKNWGFKYHLTMVWCKNTGLCMYGFQRNCEFILVGLKGKHDGYPRRKTVRACFDAKTTGHSKKPVEFFDMLDVLPYKSRLELFARQKRKGWDIWGNEVKCDVKLDV